MSVQQLNNTAYGLSQALINVFPAPIISQRAPTSADKAPFGTMWVDQPLDTIYAITSITNNAANWELISGGPGTFSTLTVTGTSDLQGAVTMDSTVDITGLLTATGGITSPANIITTSTGQINSATTMTAGTGITATAGNITASAGKVQAGTLIVATGDASGTTSQNAMSNVVAPANGTGTLTIQTSTGSSGTAVNTGFIKMYAGTQIAYIPYFNNIVP